MSVYTGANTRFGSDTDAMLRIFPSPERFYDLGVATSEFGPENEKITTTLVNGTETTEVEKPESEISIDSQFFWVEKSTIGLCEVESSNRLVELDLITISQLWGQN